MAEERRRRALYDPSVIYRDLPVQPPDTVLANLFGFVDRPSASVRALLALRPGAAARNLAQFGIDAATGGFLKRGPIQVAKSTDVIETSAALEGLGVPMPRRGSWGRFGVDLVGAFALDPLTYVGFAGPAKNLGTRVLGGLGRREFAEQAARSISRTELGRQALSRAQAEIAGELAAKAPLRQHRWSPGGRPPGGGGGPGPRPIPPGPPPPPSAPGTRFPGPPEIQGPLDRLRSEVARRLAAQGIEPPTPQPAGRPLGPPLSQAFPDDPLVDLPPRPRDLDLDLATRIHNRAERLSSLPMRDVADERAFLRELPSHVIDDYQGVTPAVPGVQVGGRDDLGEFVLEPWPPGAPMPFPEHNQIVVYPEVRVPGAGPDGPLVYLNTDNPWGPTLGTLDQIRIHPQEGHGVLPLRLRGDADPDFQIHRYLVSLPDRLAGIAERVFEPRLPRLAPGPEARGAASTLSSGMIEQALRDSAARVDRLGRLRDRARLTTANTGYSQGFFRAMPRLPAAPYTGRVFRSGSDLWARRPPPGQRILRPPGTRQAPLHPALDRMRRSYQPPPPPPPPRPPLPGPTPPPPPGPGDPIAQAHLRYLQGRLGRLPSASRWGGALPADSDAALSLLQNQIRARAVERVLQRHGGLAGRVARSAGPEVDDAVRALQRQGLMEEPHLRFMGRRVPGTSGLVPGDVARAWARWSVPGLAVRGLGKVGDRLAPNATKFFRESAGKGLDAAVGIYDKTLAGIAPPALRLGAQHSILRERQEINLGRRWLEDWAKSGPKEWDQDTWRKFGRILLEARDAEEQVLAPLAVRPGARAEGAQIKRRLLTDLRNRLRTELGPEAVQLHRGLRKVTQQIARDLRREGVWGPGFLPPTSIDALPIEQRNLVYSHEALRALSEVRDLTPPELARLDSIEDQLRGFAASARSVDTYLPYQARAEVRPTLRKGRGSAPFAAPGARDVYTREKKLTLDEFVQHVSARASEGGFQHADPWDVIETDPRKLMANRLDLHARTLGRTYLKRLASQVDDTGQWADYVASVWSPILPRGTAQAILGGGVVNGVRWAGLNRYYKDALYAPWPASWIRNLLAMPFQLALSGEGGAIPAFMRTILHAPFLRHFGGKVDRDKTMPLILRAVGGNPNDPEVKLAVATLRNMRIAGHSGDEVLKGLGQVTGHGAGILDIDADPHRLATLANQMANDAKVGPLRRYYRKAVEFGYGVTNYVENAARSQHYVHLLSKGHSPTQAAIETNKVMVDYALQGKLDRWYRDLILFGRFGAGIVPPVAEAALRRPRTVTGFAALQQASLAEEKEPGLLPEYLRGGLAVRLPGERERWLTSLGTPIEAAAQMAEGFDVIPGRDWMVGPRRTFLAGLTPPIRFPAEAATNRNFFFGDEWGSYRRAPGWLEVPTGQQEVPGWVNELIRSSPAARASSTAGRIRVARDQGDEDLLDVGLHLLTGIRSRRIDTARSAQRLVEKALEEAERRGEVGRLTRAYERKGVPLTPEAERLLEIQGALDQARRQKRRRRSAPN